MILIYTTHKNKRSAETISQTLLQKHLIACVNYMPTESCFIWEGTQNVQDEVVALYKTQEKHWHEIKGIIKDMHDHKTPCIFKLDATGDDEYEQWIIDSTS